MLEKCADNLDNKKYSYQNILAQLLPANITTFGIAAGSEQSVLTTFLNTQKEERDFSIIFHTRIRHLCPFTGRGDMSLKSFELWDSIISDNTIHVFWLDNTFYPYRFKSGYSITLDYHNQMNTMADDNNYINAHHMNITGNILLARNLYNIMKDKILK